MGSRTSSVRNVRVFISSPGDVVEERQKARQVVELLQKRYVGRLALESVLWEDLPLSADLSFQEGIDYVLSGEQAIDVAVFILWSRLGSPLGHTIRKPDGSEYRSGTEREFDLMLAARLQSGGQRPEILAYVRQDDKQFKSALMDKSADEIEAMVRQRKLAERFVQEQFHDPETGTNVRAYHTFHEPVSFAHRLKTHLQGLLDKLVADAGMAAGHWERPPYRGLEAFEAEHAPIFFGREEEVCEVQERMRDQAAAGCAFVLLVGASGSGKSSLARAGVLPSVVGDNIDDTVDQWRQAIMTPGQCGGDLCGGLAQALLALFPELRVDPDSLGDLRDALADQPARSLALPLKRAFADADKAGVTRAILLIDQFEELFTHAGEATDSIPRFLEALQALASSGRIWVLATVRSDFYARCQSFPLLMQMRGERGQMDILPPDPNDISRIITGPALLAGLTFEINPHGETLDQRILQDAIDHPEALPLLEYTLRELYESRTPDGVLTFAEYTALGGVEGALGKRAESVFAGQPEPVRAELSAMLNALVSVHEGDNELSFVRRRAALAEVTKVEPLRQLVDALVKERLLIADAGAVYVAHEALLRRWERARQWALDNREFLRIRKRIEDAAAQWVAEHRSDDFLLPKGKPLAEAEALLASRGEMLDDELTDYVRRSAGHHAALEKRTRHRWQAAAAVLAVLAVAALISAVWALSAEAEAGRQAMDARRQEAVALEQAALARLAEEHAQSSFASMLAATDKLAVEIVRELRWNGNVPTNEKLYLARAFDQSFRDLLGETGDQPEIELRHAALLIGLADMLFEVGRVSEASAYAERGYAIVDARQDQLLPEARLDLLVRGTLARARAFLMASNLAEAGDGVTRALDWLHAEADRLDPRQAARLTAEAAVLRSELRKLTLDQTGETEAAAGIEAIDRALSMLDGDEAPRAWLATMAGVRMQLVHQHGAMRVRGRQATSAAFADRLAGELQRMQPLAADDHDLRLSHTTPLISYYRAQGMAESGDFDSAVDAMSIALDQLYRSLRTDPGNLRLRQDLGMAYVYRAAYSHRRNDLTQMRVDFDHAERTLKSIERDAPGHPALGAVGAQLAHWYAVAHVANDADAARAKMSAFVSRHVLPEDAPDHVPNATTWYVLPWLLRMHAHLQAQHGDSEQALATLSRGLDLLDGLATHGASEDQLAAHRLMLLHEMLTRVEPTAEEQFDHLFSQAIAVLEQTDQAAQTMRVRELEALIRGERADRLRQREAYSAAVDEYRTALQTWDAYFDTAAQLDVSVGNAIYCYRRIVECLLASGRFDGLVQMAAEADRMLQQVSAKPFYVANARAQWTELERTVQALLGNGEHSDAARVALAGLVERGNRLLAEPNDPEGAVSPVTLEPTLDLARLTFDSRDPITLAGGGTVVQLETRMGWSSEPIFPGVWRTLIGEELDAAVELFDQVPVSDPVRGAVVRLARQIQLPFYDGGRLLEYEYRTREGEQGIHTLLVIPGVGQYSLTGAANPIHEANAEAPLRLATVEQASSYLRFFCAYLTGTEGTFQIVESVSEISWLDTASVEAKVHVGEVIRPLVVWKDARSEASWRATATIQYSNVLFYAEFVIEPSGMVEMVQDVPVGRDLPIEPRILTSRSKPRESVRTLDLRAIGIEE